MGKVTKLELIKLVKDELEKKGVEISTNKLSEVVNTLIDTVTHETLKKGNDIVIPGFGKFYVVEKGGKKMRIPGKEKKMVMVPKYKTIKFKVSTKLRD